MDENSARTNSGSPSATLSSSNAAEIARLVDQMVGSMRPPEINQLMFISGAEKMFARFPIEACRDVADPGGGYPATERFAPSLASLRLALEAAARPYRLQREREARDRRLAEARAEQRAEDAVPRPTYEELQRRCAAAGLVIGARRRRPAFDAEAESERVRNTYGISKEAWDAIPKAGA